MSPPVKPESEFERWKAEQEFEAWKKSQGTAALQDMNAMSARSARASAREAQNAEEKKLTPVERVGAATQTALGMASFGVGNLAGDAIDAAFSDRTFAANRQARRMTTDAMPTMDRMASTLSGALANPASVLLRAPATAGSFMRAAYAAGDAAVQGGVTGAVENFDEPSGAGVGRAMRGGLLGAATAVPAMAATRGAFGVLHGTKTLARVLASDSPDIVAFRMRDALRQADNIAYGKVDAEAAAAGTTPDIDAVLQSQTVRPFADMIRASETHAGSNPAVVLTEAFKLMSRAQRKAGKTIDGTPEFLADLELRKSDIGKAKSRMLDAAEAPDAAGVVPIPSMRPAVDQHRVMSGEIGAFQMTKDAIDRVLNNHRPTGAKLEIKSPEALRREIAKMTQAEAEAALEATLGATKGIFRITNNPLSLFGVAPSIARGLRAPMQINPFIALLEKQAGRTQDFFDNPVVRERVRGTAARAGGAVGGLLSQDR